MGKGDKKTRKGKIIQKSFGVSRPQRPKIRPVVTAKTTPAREKAVKPADAETEKLVSVPLAETSPPEPVEIQPTVTGETKPEGIVKKKVAKTTKKTKTAEPELDLNTNTGEIPVQDTPVPEA